MIAPGVLLDTGPLVALLNRRDVNHERARKIFGACAPPFRCCEAVIAEACFLLGKVHRDAPAEVASLARRGVYTIEFAAQAQWPALEAILKKYANRPASFADACLIRCAELYAEPRIATFDGDFDIYRWGRNRRFEAA